MGLGRCHAISRESVGGELARVSSGSGNNRTTGTHGTAGFVPAVAWVPRTTERIWLEWEDAMRSVNLWRWTVVAVLAIALMVACAPGWSRAEAALWTEPGGVTREDPDLGRLNQAMIRLAKSPSLRRRLGAGARRRALAYSWERSVDSVLAAYDRLRRVP